MRIQRTSSPRITLYKNEPEQKQNLFISLFRSSSNTPTSKRFTTCCNMKGKIQHLNRQFAIIDQMSQEIFLTNKDIRTEIRFIREEYQERRLNAFQKQLQEMIKVLRKRMTIQKRSSLLKKDALNNMIKTLGKNYGQIRKKVDEIQKRTQYLQIVLGNDTNVPYHSRFF